uniref:Uncharacterized protein n=1 Tax=Globodera rostochiensis TaxID=31243 RepID=A0A914HWV9_GLORO
MEREIDCQFTMANCIRENRLYELITPNEDMGQMKLELNKLIDCKFLKNSKISRRRLSALPTLPSHKRDEPKRAHFMKKRTFGTLGGKRTFGTLDIWHTICSFTCADSPESRPPGVCAYHQHIATGSWTSISAPLTERNSRHSIRIFSPELNGHPRIVSATFAPIYYYCVRVRKQHQHAASTALGVGHHKAAEKSTTRKPKYVIKELNVVRILDGANFDTDDGLMDAIDLLGLVMQGYVEGLHIRGDEESGNDTSEEEN